MTRTPTFQQRLLKLSRARVLGSKRERRMVRWAHMLIMFDAGFPLADIARETGVSRERVRQITSKFRNL